MCICCLDVGMRCRVDKLGVFVKFVSSRMGVVVVLGYEGVVIGGEFMICGLCEIIVYYI